MKNINYLDPPPLPPPPVSGSIPPWSTPPPGQWLSVSAVSVCPFWTWCYELLHVPPIQLVHLRPQSSQQTTSQESLHTQHAEPRGALRQLLTPLVVFIFQGLPRHHVRLRVASYESCRASRCTQATYESTLSPTHLMQQLLAFVHPLLKFTGVIVSVCRVYETQKFGWCPFNLPLSG